MRKSNYLISFFTVLLGLATLFFYGEYIKPNHDVTWLAYAANDWLSGGNYLDDFFETNPPMSILLYAPSALLHQLLGLDLHQGVRLQLLLLIVLNYGLLIYFCRHCIRHTQLHFLPEVLLLLLAIVPGYHFAQKEHFLLLLFIPYVFLFIAECLKLKVSLAVYVLVAVLGALALTIKPYYALIPALMMCCRMAYMRGILHLFKKDFFIFIAVVMCYLMTVYFVFPEYFKVLTWVGALYSQFAETSNKVFYVSVAFVAISTLAFFVIYRLVRSDAILSLFNLVWLICILGAITVFAYQGKGWFYHMLPTLIFIGVQLVFCIYLISRRLLAVNGRLILMAAALSYASIFWLAGSLKFKSAYYNKEIIQALESLELKPGDSIYAFSASIDPFFPYVVERQLNWAGRFVHLWPAVVTNLESEAEAREISSLFKVMITQDLLKHAPKYVIVDHQEQQGFGAKFDYLGYFSRNAEFASQWQDYHSLSFTELGERPSGYSGGCHKDVCKAQ